MNKIVFALVISLMCPPLVFAQQAARSQAGEASRHAEIKEKETSMYADFFDKNVYDRVAQWFYIPRTLRKIFGVKQPALDVNIYDEVPDSNFFTNRIGRRDMSAREIIEGPERTAGPDTAGSWLITKGKFEGISPGFFIKDSTGNEYLIKFDPPGYPELSSGAEAIVSRIFYAYGFNVPQYTVCYFDPKILTVWEGATYYGKSGFKKKLTLERVIEALENVDRTKDGFIRCSASLKVEGIYKGPMSLDGYRKEDPKDFFRHRNMREIRALPIFASWVNNHDIRKGNTLSTWVTEDGAGYLKHYFIDFGSSFGSAGDRVKDLTFTHEFFLDYKSILWQTATLGLLRRDWDKRWEKNEYTVEYPSAGYFDNLYFVAQRWKPEIPHYAFDDMTHGDAFWAAKIMMRIRPELLKQLMKAGAYSAPEAEEYLYNVLVERQRLIGAAWFSKVTPLDEFVFRPKAQGNVHIEFDDLELLYGVTEETPRYRYEITHAGHKGKEVALQGFKEFSTSELHVPLNAFRASGPIQLRIQKYHSKTNRWNPPVVLTLAYDSSKNEFALAGIWHKDQVA
ncbi:MAG: hypothetical protein HY586_06475 [Candidatus Omnitrophica bacterium]|nr:hypothetical protein [Candidatus Omnitrophota bacterium]